MVKKVALYRSFDSIKTDGGVKLVLVRKRPSKGEIFLSGSIPAPYKAPRNSGTYRWVIENPEVITSEIL